MPLRDPDHRWRATSRSLECPEHAIEAELWRAMRGLGPHGDASMAHEVYTSDARWCMQGWILSKAKDYDIASRTGVPEGLVRAYRHLFFDVTVFRHHFDIIAWIKGLNGQPGYDEEALQFLRWAVMYGSEAVAFLSGVPVYIDARTVQEQAMINSHFRALQGRDAAIDSAAAKEALKHQQVAVSQAAILSKAAPPSARDFAVKLKHREMTTPIEVVDKTTEVLH